MRWLAPIAWCLCAAAWSQAPADDAAPDPVDIEFLEYLGTLVFGGEEWVGPDDMAAPIDLDGAEDTAERAPREPIEDAFERDLREDPP